MKTISGLITVLILAVALTGCSSAFWGGAGAGALGGAAGYEIQAEQQMNKLNEDLTNFAKLFDGLEIFFLHIANNQRLSFSIDAYKFKSNGIFIDITHL